LIGLWLLFLVITVAAQRFIPGLFGWDAVDYGDLATSTDSIVQNLVTPLLASTLLVIIVASTLKWWGPVMKDNQPIPL